LTTSGLLPLTHRFSNGRAFSSVRNSDHNSRVVRLLVVRWPKVNIACVKDLVMILPNFDCYIQRVAIPDMPHNTDYPYPIRILAVFLGDTAVLHFDRDFN